MSRLHVTNEYVLELNNVYHAGQVQQSSDLERIQLMFNSAITTDGGFHLSGKNGWQ